MGVDNYNLLGIDLHSQINIIRVLISLEKEFVFIFVLSQCRYLCCSIISYVEDQSL